MKKTLLALFMAALLFLTPARAWGADGGAIQIITDDSVSLTDEEKAIAAGEMLSGIISLIMSKYTGSQTNPESLYESAIRGIMERLDPYSVYFSPEELSGFEKSLSGNLFGIGVSLEIDADGAPVIAWVVQDSPAEKAGLAKGDRFLEIDGQELLGLSLDKTIALITAAKDTVRLRVQTESGPRELSIPKVELKFATVFTEKFENLLDEARDRNNAGLRYIGVSSVGEDTAQEFQSAIERLRKEGVSRIVLDLRGNPGGYMDVILQLCQFIVPKGPILFTVDKDGNRVVINSNLEKSPFEKVVVLTNNSTASAAEVLASALQDAKAASIVGEKTFGKGVIQSLYRLPTGGAIKLTTEKYLRRSGSEIDQIGVTPDVIVSAGPARQLQQAYDMLRK
ncbi:MAG: S41 family peptidase [Clostridiales bacterium]|jgi:carboxyl-terminal processing protease|nr:S41 family peptidase [Clostridiales bacterium]